MTALRVVKVTRQPVEEEAVQFDGTPECGAAILAWIHANCDWSHGHFRPAATHQTGSIFVPGRYGVMRADPGDWVIRDGNEFRACPAVAFAEHFEVVP